MPKIGTNKINKNNNAWQMNNDLLRFLIHYNLYRRDGSLRREIKVKTPFDAVGKWYEIKPKIFKTSLLIFNEKKLLLKSKIKISC